MAIKLFITCIISAIAYLLGGWDSGLEALVIMTILDYLTGMMKAVSCKALCSKIGWLGLIRKTGIFLAVMVSVQVERIINQPNTLHNFVAYAFIVNEGISIIENLGACGVPIPPVLINFFNKLKDREKIMGG